MHLWSLSGYSGQFAVWFIRDGCQLNIMKRDKFCASVRNVDSKFPNNHFQVIFTFYFFLNATLFVFVFIFFNIFRNFQERFEKMLKTKGTTNIGLWKNHSFTICNKNTRSFSYFRVLLSTHQCHTILASRFHTGQYYFLANWYNNLTVPVSFTFSFCFSFCTIPFWKKFVPTLIFEQTSSLKQEYCIIYLNSFIFSSFPSNLYFLWGPEAM